MNPNDPSQNPLWLQMLQGGAGANAPQQGQGGGMGSIPGSQFVGGQGAARGQAINQIGKSLGGALNPLLHPQTPQVPLNNIGGSPQSMTNGLGNLAGNSMGDMPAADLSATLGSGAGAVGAAGLPIADFARGGVVQPYAGGGFAGMQVGAPAPAAQASAPTGAFQPGFGGRGNMMGNRGGQYRPWGQAGGGAGAAVGGSPQNMGGTGQAAPTAPNLQMQPQAPGVGGMTTPQPSITPLGPRTLPGPGPSGGGYIPSAQFQGGQGGRTYYGTGPAPTPGVMPGGTVPSYAASGVSPGGTAPSYAAASDTQGGGGGAVAPSGSSQRPSPSTRSDGGGYQSLQPVRPSGSGQGSSTAAFAKGGSIVPAGVPAAEPMQAEAGMRRYSPIGPRNPSPQLQPKPEDMSHRLPSRIPITPRLNIRLPRPKMPGAGGVGFGRG